MDTRKTTPHRECRVRQLCRIGLQASRRSPHNVQPGSLGERDAVSSPGYEAGRRRAIGVVAALAINPRATTPMVRRWAAGRRCVPAVQKAGANRTQWASPLP